MQSSAASVAEYLESLPEDRRTAVSTIRDVILGNLDADFEEGMNYGMISYFVPHRVYAAGYHCKPSDPLPYAALASQKNHIAIYLMSIYGDPSLLRWFTDAWKKTGKKLDMGKSCVRFKKLEEVALEVVAEAIRRVPVGLYIERYEAALKGGRGTSAKGSSKAGAKSTKTAKSDVSRSRASETTPSPNAKTASSKKTGVKSGTGARKSAKRSPRS